MAKPFSIQSPEQIAKEYGGNKQKIAQAMQLGIVDATAGVLAGMFIDRMRSGQMQEAAQQPTVAQQVMQGATPAPMQQRAITPGAPPITPAVPATAGALGGGMQAAASMGPGGKPVGMSAGGSTYAAPYAQGGGLSDLPVPDTMFDEPSNGGFGDGYAGGGLIAFAGGGGIDADELRAALRAQESSGDYGVTNYEGSGAMGAYQFMPATARALAKRIGLLYRPDLMAGAGGRSKEGREYQERLMDEQMKDILRFSGGDINKAAAYHFAGPNTAGWGKDTRQYMADIQRRMGRPEAPTPTTGAPSLAPPTDTLAAAIPGAEREARNWWEANVPTPKNEGLGALMEAARKTVSPEEQKRRRDEDKWMTLAEIGFNMASTSSPYLLQAVGAAAAAALPGAKAAKKEREADLRQAYRDLAEAEGITYKQAVEKANGIRTVMKDRLNATESDIKNAANIWERQYSEAAQTERTGMQVQGQKDVAAMHIQGQKDVANITAEQRMDKGLEGLMNSYLQMGINEAKAKGQPVDMPALKARAYQLALAEWNKYKTTQSGMIDANNNGIPDYMEARPVGGGGGGQSGVVNVPWPQ